MITDELLIAAAGEVSACILDGLPPVVEHDFSRKFQRKMKHLIFRTDHPTMHLLRNCAAVLLVLLTAFATLMTASPTVRAAVIQWVKGIYMGETVYSFEGQSAVQQHQEYFLSKVPDGYTLDEVWEFDYGKQYYYHSSENEVMYFWYSYGKNDLTFYLDTRESDYYSIPFTNGIADIYLSKNAYESNKIVWSDPNNNVLFIVSYFGETSELIELAESVKNK